MPDEQPLGDLRGLVLGEHIRDHGVDAEESGDPVGGGLVVPGEHCDLDALLVESVDRGLCGVPGCVGETDDPGDLPVHGEQDRGAAGPSQVLLSGLHPADVDPLPGEKARVAEDDLSTVDGGDRALPGDVSERGRGATGDVAGVG
ncbi:hypothetical protein FF38_13444, partial [Lucilia cuprina]